MSFRGWPCSAIAAGTIVISLSAAWIHPTKPVDGPQITLLYVGARDCPPCRAWESNEALAFRASWEFERVIYREVKSPTLFDVLDDRNWPDDLRRYRDQIGRDAGVPLWLVIADNRVIQRGMGREQWRSNLVPKIKLLLRDSDVAPPSKARLAHPPQAGTS